MHFSQSSARPEAAFGASEAMVLIVPSLLVRPGASCSAPTRTLISLGISWKLEGLAISVKALCGDLVCWFEPGPGGLHEPSGRTEMAGPLRVCGWDDDGPF